MGFVTIWYICFYAFECLAFSSPFSFFGTNRPDREAGAHRSRAIGTHRLTEERERKARVLLHNGCRAWPSKPNWVGDFYAGRAGRFLGLWEHWNCADPVRIPQESSRLDRQRLTIRRPAEVTVSRPFCLSVSLPTALPGIVLGPTILPPTTSSKRPVGLFYLPWTKSVL